MRVAGLAMIMYPRSMVVLAFKCLTLNGLALFRLLLRSRVLRIV
jgi:hypothetical protein